MNSFKCKHCPGDLIVPPDEGNMFTTADQKKCAKAITKLRYRFGVFDDYVIPPNFFGPGSVYAYVGPGTALQFEDIQNVHFNFYKGKEFLCPIKKQKVPVSAYFKDNHYCLF